MWYIHRMMFPFQNWTLGFTCLQLLAMTKAERPGSMSYWCDGDGTKRLETQWRSVWTRTWQTKTEVLRSIPKAVLASFDCFWAPNIGLSYSWIFIYLGTQLHKETYWNRSWPGSTAHEFRFASIPRWQSWGWPSRVRLTPVKLQAWPGRWGRHWYFDTF